MNLKNQLLRIKMTGRSMFFFKTCSEGACFLKGMIWLICTTYSSFIWICLEKVISIKMLTGVNHINFFFFEEVSMTLVKIKYSKNFSKLV